MSLTSVVYHRIESPTQTPVDAIAQESSHEVWGRPSRYSDIPAVKAYVGPLPVGARGVEFATSVPPDPDCPPGHAYWSGPRNGVRVQNDIARLDVDRLTNGQREAT